MNKQIYNKLQIFILILCFLCTYASQKQITLNHKNHNSKKDSKKQLLQDKQWFFGDDLGDERDWKEKDWSIYDLLKLEKNVKDVFDKCDDLDEIQKEMDAWHYFLDDPQRFFTKSLEDLHYFEETLQELMDARKELFDKIEDIADTYDKVDEIQVDEDTENEDTIFGDIFGTNKQQKISKKQLQKEKEEEEVVQQQNNKEVDEGFEWNSVPIEDQQIFNGNTNYEKDQNQNKQSKKLKKGIKHNKKLSEKDTNEQQNKINENLDQNQNNIINQNDVLNIINKEEDNNINNNDIYQNQIEPYQNQTNNKNNDIINLAQMQIPKQLDEIIVISRNRMLFLHKTLMSKGKELKDILISQGPLGGGQDIEDLFTEIQKIFKIIFERYEQLKDSAEDYEEWFDTLESLYSKLYPHIDDCNK